jgi:anti-anti-sigma factor
MITDETGVNDLFDVHVDLAGDVRVVAVSGEVDLDTAERFNEGLGLAMQGGTGPVVVDLCRVPFMDSTGLHLLLNALRRLTRQRRALAIACEPIGVRRLFELTRMDGTFDLYASRPEAVAALQGGRVV